MHEVVPSLLIASVAALGLAACGGDAERPRLAAPEVTPATRSAERYCALVRELDAAGEKVFGALGRDATAAEYEAAEREFIRRNQGRLEELEAAAPQAIAGEVATLLEAQRGRAGLGSAVEDARASAAEKRLRAFERRSCE